MKVRERRDIEWLVTWALIDNGLGRVFGTSTKINWMDWGVVVDQSRSSGSWIGSALGVKNDDAMVIADAIGQLHPDCAQLIIRHGRIGDRPDWIEEGVGTLQQMRDGQGRLMWKWADPSNKSAKRSERSARMEFVGETQANVDYYRAQYDLWWIGLHDLIDPLNAAMAGHEATGPRAKDRPWLQPATVFGADGQPVTGLHDSVARLAALERRGSMQEAEQAVD